MNTTVRHHLALQELSLLSQCDREPVARIADVILAVWGQYCDHAVEYDDFVSIVQRNISELKALEPSRERDLAIVALEDLV